jgi:hypothetical protein
MRSEKATAGQTYLRQKGIKWGRMEEALEEGHDPHRAKPVIMNNFTYHCIYFIIYQSV